MISVEKAMELVNENTFLLKPISLSLEKSLGYVLQDDVVANISLPPFQQSAMDGYAIANLDNNNTNKRFRLIGESKAGEPSKLNNLQDGEAIRIFTGAMVPKGATAVIMQENTELIGDEVQINQEINAGSNIRPIGEQIKEGELALAKGTTLNPAAIGFLRSFGITHVTVYSKPKIGVIVTGNELVQAGQELENGQIYESNSSMLVAALEQSGINSISVKRVPDNLEQTIQIIQELMSAVDVLILSGGISVGDYDFVGKALEIINVEQVFYKVKQKPGKPLFYGKKGECQVFALPGNPSASLVCYYKYVLPSLDKMRGKSVYGLVKKELGIKNNYFKKGDRAQFLKASVIGNEVEILEGQSSAMLHTFSIANALVYLPANTNQLEKGDLVDTYLLPQD